MTTSNEHNNAPAVPDGLQWFTVAEHGIPEIGAEVIGGLWYTDPWIKTEFATTFMWGQCRVVESKHRDFKDGKQWCTFGPSHNQITHWARINTPGQTSAPAPAVPQGWKLVPVEPTEAMSIAGGIAWESSLADDVIGPLEDAWAAMLAATPAPAPAQEVTLTLAAEDVHAAFTKNFPKSRISQAWINFAADIAQAIAARAAKPAQEVGLTEQRAYRLLQAGIDQIEAADEFLSDDTTTWAIDPNGIFVGATYMGNVLRPARRAIIAALRAKGGKHV